MNEKNKILVIGHRGASIIAPENTIKAFKEAIRLEADLIEFDVQESKDHELVVTHDEDLSRITGEKGLLSDFSLEELKKLDFGDGEQIPTLEELIRTTKGKIGLNCEIKVPGIAQKVINTLKENEILDSTIISSFLHDELLEIQKIEPKAKLASLEPTGTAKIMNWETKKSMIQYCIDNNLYAINPIIMIVDQQFVDFAHEFNIKVFPWTVDRKISIKKLMNFGVDGIITNDIETLKTILNR